MMTHDASLAGRGSDRSSTFAGQPGSVMAVTRSELLAPSLVPPPRPISSNLMPFVQRSGISSACLTIIRPANSRLTLPAAKKYVTLQSRVVFSQSSKTQP